MKSLRERFHNASAAEMEGLARRVYGHPSGNSTFDDNMERIRPGLEVAEAWLKTQPDADTPALINLIADMEAVIEDMVKSTGGALIVQDYGKLNAVLIEAAKLRRATSAESPPATEYKGEGHGTG